MIKCITLLILYSTLLDLITKNGNESVIWYIDNYVKTLSFPYSENPSFKLPYTTIFWYGKMANHPWLTIFSTGQLGVRQRSPYHVRRSGTLSSRHPHNAILNMHPPTAHQIPHIEVAPKMTKLCTLVV